MKNITENFKDITSLSEGLLDAFKIRRQITKVQAACEELYNAAIEKDPKHFRSGEDVMNALKNKAFELYKKEVTIEGAMSVDEWWKDYSKANAHFLNMTLFKQTKK